MKDKRPVRLDKHIAEAAFKDQRRDSGERLDAKELYPVIVNSLFKAAVQIKKDTEDKTPVFNHIQPIPKTYKQLNIKDLTDYLF